MARGKSRFDLEQKLSGYVRLGVVGNSRNAFVQSRFDGRKNLLADYTAAFSNEFLTSRVLELIRQELEEEIMKELRGNERTRRLADGLEGKTIQEKRHGRWEDVPRPEADLRARSRQRGGIFSAEGAPILIQIVDIAAGEMELTVRLNHPLYLVMHEGSGAHAVPPRRGFHLFPTRHLLEKDPRAQYSHYGPRFFDLRQVPWRDPNAESTEVEYYTGKTGNRLKKRRKPALKWIHLPKGSSLPAPGFAPPVPFVRVAWKRVIARARKRTPQTISARMASRGI